MGTSSSVMFSSDLPDARERLLAHMLSDGIAKGLRTPDDLLRNFDPLQIMQALRDEPELRAKILEPTVGTRAKIALRKTPDSAGIDLQLALEEEETDPATIAEYFDIDDQVRFLDREELWAHCTENRFWDLGPDDGEFEEARQHLLYLVGEAISEELLSARDIVAGLTTTRLMDELPPELRTRILDATLAAGRAGAAFSDAQLLEVVNLEEITEHIALEVLWSDVLEGLLAPTGQAAKVAPKVEAKSDKVEAKTSKVEAKPKVTPPKIEVIEPPAAAPEVVDGDEPDLFDSDALLDEIQLAEFEVDEVSEEIPLR